MSYVGFEIVCKDQMKFICVLKKQPLTLKQIVKITGWSGEDESGR